MPHQFHFEQQEPKALPRQVRFDAKPQLALRDTGTEIPDLDGEEEAATVRLLMVELEAWRPVEGTVVKRVMSTEMDPRILDVARDAGDTDSDMGKVSVTSETDPVMSNV